MNTNIKNTARMAYLGVKELMDFLENAGHYTETKELLDDLNDIIINNQPLLACYCLDVHFNGEQPER